MNIKKYKNVSEIAEMFGLSKVEVRNRCHARGQNFALRFNKNGGRFYIDPEKFGAYLERMLK